MWGEVLAAFVGAISGGAILALLTWYIYRKEKLAATLKKIYTLESIILADHEQLFFLNFPFVSSRYEKIASADLFSEIRISMSEIKAVVTAHSPSSMCILELLDEAIKEYLVEREEFLYWIEDNDLHGKARYSKVTTEFENIAKEIRLLAYAVEQPQLPQICSMLLFLNPEQWNHKKTPDEASTDSQPNQDTPRD